MRTVSTAGWGLILAVGAAAANVIVAGPAPAGAAVHPPLIRQDALDCEAASLAMALAVKGITVSQDVIQASFPQDPRTSQGWGTANVRWGDPYTAFVGSVNGSEPAGTGYGVYWPQVVAAAQRFGALATGGEGYTPDQIYAAVAAGNPVLVWVVLGAYPQLAAPATRYWTAWDGRVIPYSVGDHVEVLDDVDRAAGVVILNDPDRAGSIDRIPIAGFEASWGVLGHQAVIVGQGGIVGDAPTSSGNGFYRVDGAGGVRFSGDAVDRGAWSPRSLNQPMVGMAVTPDGGGYWLVAADGGIFPFGDAGGYGSTGGLRLNQPIVGIAATNTGHGYWLVAADGGIFPFGDAPGWGSTGAMTLNRAVVGIAAVPMSACSGQIPNCGYWLVAADGGIFPFGPRAAGLGSTGEVRLARPMVGMAATRSGGGYWLVAADGGVFPFGDAGGYGSTGGRTIPAPVIGMTRDGGGDGYWLAAADGTVFSFGSAPPVAG